MSDSNHEPNQLETLQQMLEAEMRGNPEPPKAPEKPAPAVAKPDDLGSLLGDLLSVYADVRRVGNTSLTIDVEVMVQRRGAMEEMVVTQGVFVFVAIGEDGRPRPVPKE